MTRKVAQALVDQVPKVRQSLADLIICTDGYQNGKPWRRLNEVVANRAAPPCSGEIAAVPLDSPRLTHVLLRRRGRHP